MFKSNQTLLNQAVRGIFKQRKQAIIQSIGCSYKNEEGDRCAVGQLIPKKKYKETMEGLPPEDALVLSGIISEDDRYAKESFLGDLQFAHDVCGQSYDKPARGKKFLDEFAQNIRQLCEKHNLKVPSECQAPKKRKSTKG